MHSHGKPTVEVLEKRVAALEGGSAAVACASGQAAVFQTVLSLAHTGDNVVSSTNVYGGTYSLFKSVLPRIGITVKWIHDDDPESYRRLIDDRTKLIFVETVGNPRVSIPDITAIANIAHEHGLPLVVSSSFLTPPAFPASSRPVPFRERSQEAQCALPRLTTHLARVGSGVQSSNME